MIRRSGTGVLLLPLCSPLQFVRLLTHTLTHPSPVSLTPKPSPPHRQARSTTKSPAHRSHLAAARLKRTATRWHPTQAHVGHRTCVCVGNRLHLGMVAGFFGTVSTRASSQACGTLSENTTRLISTLHARAGARHHTHLNEYWRAQTGPVSTVASPLPEAVAPIRTHTKSRNGLPLELNKK
jgi:hypothetical protein